jgi:hypothetical protein
MIYESVILGKRGCLRQGAIIFSVQISAKPVNSCPAVAAGGVAGGEAVPTAKAGGMEVATFMGIKASACHPLRG